MTRFCFLLQGHKEGPAGEACKLSPPGDSAPPLGDYRPGPRGSGTRSALHKAPPRRQAITALATKFF